MGRLKMELTNRINESDEKGREIIEKGNEDLENARETDSIISGMETLDEDDVEIVESGLDEARSITQMVEETDITVPTDRVIGSLKEVNDEATGYSEIEDMNAKSAREIEGNYDSVSSNMESKYSESKEQYDELGDKSDTLSVEIDDTTSEIKQMLDELF